LGVLSLSGVHPVLALEASTVAGSVALFVEGRLMASADVPMGVGRSDGLFPALSALLAEAGVAPAALAAVVCGAGPGSFTSLRIAAALAKGLAHGASLPLYAVPSLLLAAASLPPEAAPGEYLMHGDALRGERYLLRVRRHADGTVVLLDDVSRVTSTWLSEHSEAAKRVAVGAPLEAVSGAHTVSPHARQLPLAHGAWRDTPVDLATWEPAYGRLAEAQVKWEASHGMALPPSGVA
jgi:tRNA threonylcarbamoyladenosine biosynthesis protein TsaB